MGCSRKKVINAINLFNDTGSLSNKKRKSRERKTTPREDATIARIAKLNPFVGAPKIKEQIAQNLKLDLSVSTVKSRLRENKLFGRVARKKPLVSKRNLVSRLKFAKQHVHKDLSFWQNVLWTDESKFNRFVSDGKQYVRRPQNQELSPRYTLKIVKHGGGNVIVWAVFHGVVWARCIEFKGQLINTCTKKYLKTSCCHMPRKISLWFGNSNKTTTLSTPPKVLKCGLTLRRLMYWSGPHNHQT